MERRPTASAGSRRRGGGGPATRVVVEPPALLVSRIRRRSCCRDGACCRWTPAGCCCCQLPGRARATDGRTAGGRAGRGGGAGDGGTTAERQDGHFPLLRCTAGSAVCDTAGDTLQSPGALPYLLVRLAAGAAGCAFVCRSIHGSRSAAADWPHASETSRGGLGGSVASVHSGSVVAAGLSGASAVGNENRFALGLGVRHSRSHRHRECRPVAELALRHGQLRCSDRCQQAGRQSRWH